LVIVDLDFLKSILSAEENMHNGLLIGDRLETKFRTVYDPLMSSTTYEVVKVLKLARAPKMEQQEVFDFN
jgi:hypothetical protein